MNLHSVLSWASGSGAYGASKAALWSLSNSLRLELAGQGTQVLGVHVGFVDTEMVAALKTKKISPDLVVEKVLGPSWPARTRCWSTGSPSRSKRRCRAQSTGSPSPSAAETPDSTIKRSDYANLARVPPRGRLHRPQEREFADRVTDFHQPLGLPRFYVVPLFHEVSQGSFYVGGEPVDDVVRVVIERTAQDPARRAAGRHRIADMIQPFVAGK